MSYMVLKYVHVAAVSASFVLFFLRGIWMMQASARLSAGWVRVVPHVVDTVLLASAIALAVLTAQYPFVQSWLTAKVLALLVYIVLGSIALRYGRTRRVRIASWVLALLVFGYIVAVARAHNPVPWNMQAFGVEGRVGTIEWNARQIGAVSKAGSLAQRGSKCLRAIRAE